MPDTSIHRTTLRYPSQYHEYLDFLHFKTGLDVSQIIRLCIHLAPYNPEFNRIISQETLKLRIPYHRTPEWDAQSHLWKDQKEAGSK